MDFNNMSKTQIINWMSQNLSTKELEDCLNKTGNSTMSVSKTPSLSSSSKQKRTSSGGYEETKRGSSASSSSSSSASSSSSSSSMKMLSSAKRQAIEMCKNMKHIVINSVTFKGDKKTTAQIRYNVSKTLLKKSAKGVKGDVIAVTLTFAALKKECIKMSKMTKTKKSKSPSKTSKSKSPSKTSKSKSPSKTSKFGNKKSMEKYLLNLLRPN
jgi:hypothetical protein